MLPKRPFDSKAAQFLLQFHIYIDIEAGEDPGWVFPREFFYERQDFISYDRREVKNRFQKVLFNRSLILLALSILPLVVGLATLSGIMVIFHLDFNFLNLIVLPMIIGIGIDDGVHLVNTFSQTKSTTLLEGVSQTGRAVILTSLTTLVGFGSIALSHYPGLRSMGYVACIGISTCLFASIIVTTAIFPIISGRSRRLAG